MKIRTRLRLNTFISVGTFIFILLSLLWSGREILIADRNTTLVNEMRTIAFERILLRDEYLLYQDERPARQWHAKSKELRKLFEYAGDRFTREEDRNLLQAAWMDFDSTYSGFSRVIEDHARQGRTLNIKSGFSDAGLRQISQVFLKAYSLTDNINRLHGSAQTKAKNMRNRGAFIVLLFFFGGITATIINSMVIRRTLVKRITELDKGVKILGSGNLDYRISVEGDDELAALAQASNEMAAELKKTHISFKHLEKEVELRKRTEEELQRSNKELEQFAYVASHDLQEPLRMVSSYTQLLAERYQDKLDDKANLFIHYAVDGAVRMQLLINDLLAFSRVGSKGKPLQPVDAQAVLGEAIKNLKLSIAETKSTITQGQLPEVRADASQLAQLFQNLIGNAIKFRGAESPQIHISAADAGTEWLFSVRDYGIGIDPQFTDKIFIIFQRLHTKEEYPGSGIGLAICKKIVERHGGRIWFESEPGKGATFYFTLQK